MNDTFTDKRLSKATSNAFKELQKGTNGNGREMASCVATLFVDTMRLLGVPDYAAIEALKATYAAIAQKGNMQ